METVSNHLNGSPVEHERKETRRKLENFNTSDKGMLPGFDITTAISGVNKSDDDDSGKDILSGAGEIKDLSVMKTVRITFSPHSKKLLILDLNGLLVDVVSLPPKDHKPDKRVGIKSFFARPFYLDFLKFCFERFEVAVWSSRTKKNIDILVDYLFGDMKNSLLFCWDLSNCTTTQFKTLENRHKPLVFKELKKVWEKHDPQLPWERGYFNESNTLLVDDSPYKSLLNPVHSAIYPNSYSFQDMNDNSLGAGGNIRVYLEQLCGAENVQKFVEKNPFGQEAVNEGNECWSFYLQVMNTFHPSRVRDGKRVEPDECGLDLK
ncbi:Uncharacterized FCP1 homology domain-containing protein C1271.03c [Linum perenne]